MEPFGDSNHWRDRSAVTKIIRGITSRIIQDLNATSQNHPKNIKHESEETQKKQRTREQQKHQRPYYLFLGNYTTFIPTKIQLYKKLQSELSHFSRGGGCPEPCFGAGASPTSMTTDLWRSSLDTSGPFVSVETVGPMFSTWRSRFVEERSISGGLEGPDETMYLCDGSDSKVPCDKMEWSEILYVVFCLYSCTDLSLSYLEVSMFKNHIMYNYVYSKTTMVKLYAYCIFDT